MPQRNQLSLGCLLATVLAVAVPQAQADERPLNSIQLGIGTVQFNTKSGDMTGPVGATPSGIQAEVKDKTVLPFVYDRRISGPWSLTVQGGLPPVLKITAAGSVNGLGEIGSVRAWFPALMGTYTWDLNPSLAVHAGAGLHYTFFTNGATNSVYDGAFGGASSRAKFSSSLGPVIKLGASWSLDRNWFLDLSYSRYWIRTTATVTTFTPGVGDIERKLKVRTTPELVSLTLGYRF